MTNRRRGAETDQIIAKNVRLGLSKRGMSRVAYGKALGLSPATITEKLAGNITWSAFDVEETSNLLCVPIQSLYSYDSKAFLSQDAFKRNWFRGGEGDFLSSVIANNIMKYLGLANKSERQMADYMGISEDSLAFQLHGDRELEPFTAEQIYKAARFLHIPVGDLYDPTDMNQFKDKLKAIFSSEMDEEESHA